MTRPAASAIVIGIVAILAGCAGSSRQPDAAPSAPWPWAAGARRIAVTFDDLPSVSVPAGQSCDLEALRSNTAKLLDTLSAHGVPVVGFVNEGRICKSLGPEAMETLLGMWVDRGQELGNHTFAHADLDAATIEAYESDILRGETVIRKLLSERGGTLKYFRYPFLNTGRNEQITTAVAGFLAQRGYTVAPVTMSGNEWMFAAVYAGAKERGDLQTMQLVADAYIPYMQKVFGYFEAASVKLFGREIDQILLLHASALNADVLNRLMAMLQSRGCTFIPLAQALQDPAYGSADNYVGSAGYSSILRWAQTKGVSMPHRPEEPAFLRKLYAETPTQ